MYDLEILANKYNQLVNNSKEPLDKVNHILNLIRHNMSKEQMEQQYKYYINSVQEILLHTCEEYSLISSDLNIYENWLVNGRY